MTTYASQQLGRTAYFCTHHTDEHSCLICIVRVAFTEDKVPRDVARLALVDLKRLALMRMDDGQRWDQVWPRILDRDQLAADLRADDVARRRAAERADDTVRDFVTTQRTSTRWDPPSKSVARRLAGIKRRTSARLEDIGRDGTDPELVAPLN